MSHPALHVPDLSAGVALVPGAVEVLGCSPELHDEVAREILWLGLASFLAPEPDQGGFIAAHNDSGVGATNERAAAQGITKSEFCVCHHVHSHHLRLNILLDDLLSINIGKLSRAFESVKSS